MSDDARHENGTKRSAGEQTGDEPCQLPECDEDRLLGAHYCSAEHESKAARQGIRVTGPPSEVYD